jgi:class 3 adenylate cyclase
MKRTQVARHTAEVLHTAEESLEATLVHSRKALERLVAAKAELGLTGTVGDAAIAGWADAVAALETAQIAMVDAHKEAYKVVKDVDIRGVASTVWPTLGSVKEDIRAA